MATTRAVLALLGGTGAGAGALLAWDYQTRSKMRRLRPYNPANAFTRARNRVLSSSPELCSLLLPTLSLAELGEFRGGEHVYFAAAGVVYDVSGSALFAPGGAYGENWAGRDATVALATTSLDPSAVNSMAWTALA